jgi:hypothetical protein
VEGYLFGRDRRSDYSDRKRAGDREGTLPQTGNLSAAAPRTLVLQLKEHALVRNSGFVPCDWHCPHCQCLVFRAFRPNVHLYSGYTVPGIEHDCMMKMIARVRRSAGTRHCRLDLRRGENRACGVCSVPCFYSLRLSGSLGKIPW